MARKFKQFVERPKPRKRPGRHTKRLNKHQKRQMKGWHYFLGYYITLIKEKIITIKPKSISQKQWAILLLELNILRKAWRPYGVNMEISAPGLKRIVDWGTRKYGTDHSKWWSVSTNTSHEADASKRTTGNWSRFFWSLWHTKIEADYIPWWNQPSCNEWW